MIYKAAIESIGRTTVKKNFEPKPSREMKQLRKERREMKKDFENETNEELKGEKQDRYIRKQNEIKELAVSEEQTRAVTRFQKMIKSGPNGHWDERKRMRKDNMGEW